MTNLTVNLPLFVVLSSILTLFYYSRWLRMKTAVIPATVCVNQQFGKGIS